ncbi:MAG: hypothetical protein RIA69_01200, partial [Cyclobacteriaceae bacterium]
FALSFVVIFGLIVSQCNSKIDDHNAVTLNTNEALELTLPILPETGYKFDGDLSNSIEISINNDQLWINGENYEVSEIGTVIKQANLSETSFVVMKVGNDQSMSLVLDVQAELRKANKRKVLYLGQTTEKQSFKMPFLLPPNPESNSVHVLKIDDEYARQNDLNLYKVDLSDDLGTASR